MSLKSKIITAAMSGLAIAGIVAATTLSFPLSTSAQTAAPATATATTAPGGRGERNGPQGDRVSRDKYLADALGITEADLQAAETKARRPRSSRP